MSRYVIDASAAVEYLLRTSLGSKIAEAIEGAMLIAPELLHVEVLSVLRRAVLRNRINQNRALTALEDLVDWPLDRIAHLDLIHEAWRYRHNLSAYDSFHVATARLYKAPLMTADGPLSRAPAPGIMIQNIRTV